MIEKPLKSPVEVLFCPLWGGPNKELSWEPAKCQSPGSVAWLLPAYTHTAVGANSRLGHCQSKALSPEIPPEPAVLAAGVPAGADGAGRLLSMWLNHPKRASH